MNSSQTEREGEDGGAVAFIEKNRLKVSGIEWSIHSLKEGRERERFNVSKETVGVAVNPLSPFLRVYSN